MKFRFVVNKEMEATTIEVLELSARSSNGLMRNKLITIGDLVNYLETKPLEKTRGIGAISVKEIMTKMFRYNYKNLKPERKQSWFKEFCEMNRYSNEDGTTIIEKLMKG